jgi:hypothetical protein
MQQFFAVSVIAIPFALAQTVQSNDKDGEGVHQWCGIVAATGLQEAEAQAVAQFRKSESLSDEDFGFHPLGVAIVATQPDVHICLDDATAAYDPDTLYNPDAEPGRFNMAGYGRG